MIRLSIVFVLTVLFVTDVERLAKVLPNVINNYLVPHDRFNHIDFLWGIDAPRLVYDEIIKTMKHSDKN